METTVPTIAGLPAGAVLAAGIVLVALLLVLGFAVLWRAGRSGRQLEAEAAARSAELEGRVGALLAAQSEMTGRMQAMAELLGGGQAEMSKALSDRLDGMSQRLNTSMGEATKNTHENLKRLHERLAVLDAAQRNISDLTGQVTTLSNILANKQSRGAFGQARMEAIVSDGLPHGAFAFQYTLKTGHRPDCVIYLPNGAPPLVIDAKFPLEAYSALKTAETPEEKKGAQQKFRGDLGRHVKDIREKYLVPGETHDTAFMFVPSESVFAEIHEAFDDIVQSAYRSRIVIVSPTHLLLSIQVIQAVLRDQRFREQAHVIQDEVRSMMLDVKRLDERVRKLGGHFVMVQKDVEQILISSDKVARRGEGIGEIGSSSSFDRPALAANETEVSLFSREVD